MSFLKLQIHAHLLKTLSRLKYDSPTPVQNKVIPKILRGFDLRVSAPTGTGKTAAFLLPAITNLIQPPLIKGKGPRILILVPTRELALQVASQAEKYSKNLNRIKTVCIYGGVSYHRQIRDLNGKYEIIVATPGRLIDHIERGRIILSRLEMFILDEADRMLDMGFSEPVNKISNEIQTKHQTLLFSATLKGNVLKLSKKLLNNPLEINVYAEIDKKKNIEQCLHYVDDINHKNKILKHILKSPKINQAIVFTATKRQADKLADNLIKTGYSAAALHGDMNQRQRTRTITMLRKGKLRILIATDVAARGIDVKTISHVINFDLPQDTEDYVHRIGRTGRAGASGVALSFATARERSFILSIEKFTGKKIDCEIIPGLEPTKNTSRNSYSKGKSSYRSDSRRNPSRRSNNNWSNGRDQKKTFRRRKKA